MRGNPMWRTIPFAIALTILPVAGASAQVEAQVSAEPTAEELERARAQFGQGIALAEEGEWEAALSLFREVVAVRRVPPVLYNLAHALFEMGEFAEADELLSDALEDETTPDSLRTRIEELKAEMAATGGQLTVYAQGETEGAVVLLDHRPLEPAHVGQPLTVRPGAHFVSAEREGVVVAQQRTTVELGATEEVRLVIVPGPALAAAAAERPPGHTDEEQVATAAIETEEPSQRRTVWKPVVGVLLGIGAVVGVIAITAAVVGGGTESAFDGNIHPGTVVIP